jgi:hypothetical protein
MTHPFTEKFIAMAKAAEEIQAMRSQFDMGDVILVGDKPEFLGGTFLAIKGYPTQPKMDDWTVFAICGGWIPRLDQLMGMLGTVGDFERYLRGLDYDSVIDEEGGEYHEWHQLAIILVMREKFGKAWDGEKWVKL